MARRQGEAVGVCQGQGYSTHQPADQQVQCDEGQHGAEEESRQIIKNGDGQHEKGKAKNGDDEADEPRVDLQAMGVRGGGCKVSLHNGEQCIVGRGQKRQPTAPHTCCSRHTTTLAL